MRTLIILFSGFLLWGAVIGTVRLLAGTGVSSMTTATVAFIAVWFVAAAVNMWIGITQAGYSFREELPIFLLVFLVPAVIAVLVKWKFLQ
jgi:hypothetical protein